jgi:hypothetical protein
MADATVTQGQPDSTTQEKAQPADVGASQQAQQPSVEPKGASHEEYEKRVQGLETAAAEERKKRQAAEAELQWIRQQQSAQPQPQPQQPQIDWKNEDTRFWANPAQYVHQVTMSKADEIANARVAEREKRRLVASAKRISAEKPDYPEKHQVFMRMVQNEPWLMDQVVDSSEPARELYDLVVRRQTYGSSPEEMERAIEAKVRAKLEAEKREHQAQAAVAGAVPTQAGALGSGPNSALQPIQSGHILDDVLPSY